MTFLEASRFAQENGKHGGGRVERIGGVGHNMKSRKGKEGEQGEGEHVLQ